MYTSSIENVDEWFHRDENTCASSAPIRLCCFPYAGGGAQVFQGWQRELGPDVEVFGVELPGRGRRFGQPLLHSLDELSNSIAKVISGLNTKPTAFFGHSNGALIAFEVARKLSLLGLDEPKLLILSAKKAPHLILEKRLHTLSDEALLAELRKYNGTPEEVLASPELMEVFLPILRADFSLSETYSCSVGWKYKGAVALFGGASDPTVLESELLAWAQYMEGEVSLKMFNDGHFFINTLRSEVVRAVARELSEITLAA
ncbi:thioesterase II family protein [Microbulbifer okhotskensis]|uniref:thioesterase II family protein n=1 Tax=Microbulbifer okhotskensis TaxID=2926617 RepID=UPI0021134BE3|nr:thioesterase domain-containing protein [Microbulbifer okhotskensis]